MELQLRKEVALRRLENFATVTNRRRATAVPSPQSVEPPPSRHSPRQASCADVDAAADVARRAEAVRLDSTRAAAAADAAAAAAAAAAEKGAAGTDETCADAK